MGHRVHSSETRLRQEAARENLSPGAGPSEAPGSQPLLSAAARGHGDHRLHPQSGGLGWDGHPQAGPVASRGPRGCSPPGGSWDRQPGHPDSGLMQDIRRRGHCPQPAEHSRGTPAHPKNPGAWCKMFFREEGPGCGSTDALWSHVPSSWVGEALSQQTPPAAPSQPSRSL